MRHKCRRNTESGGRVKDIANANPSPNPNPKGVLMLWGDACLDAVTCDVRPSWILTAVPWEYVRLTEFSRLKSSNIYCSWSVLIVEAG